MSTFTPSPQHNGSQMFDEKQEQQRGQNHALQKSMSYWCRINSSTVDLEPMRLEDAGTHQSNLDHLLQTSHLTKTEHNIKLADHHLHKLGLVANKLTQGRNNCVHRPCWETPWLVCPEKKWLIVRGG